jgi:hypothetical protein
MIQEADGVYTHISSERDNKRMIFNEWIKKVVVCRDRL